MTFEEILPEIKEGKKVRRGEWAKSSIINVDYVMLIEDGGTFKCVKKNGGYFYSNSIVSSRDIIADDWEIVNDTDCEEIIDEFSLLDNLEQTVFYVEIEQGIALLFKDEINREVSILPEIRSKGTAKCMVFKSSERVEQWKKKAQFIADFLLFKSIYDPDYELDTSKENVITIFVEYDFEKGKYVVGKMVNRDINTVYFSSEKIAQKCADWLNNKMKGEKRK